MMQRAELMSRTAAHSTAHPLRAGCGALQRGKMRASTLDREGALLFWRQFQPVLLDYWRQFEFPKHHFTFYELFFCMCYHYYLTAAPDE